MIRIIGDVAGISLKSFAGRVRESVPNRRSSAIFFHPALNLIGGGGAPPQKVFRELQQSCSGRLSEYKPREGGTGKSNAGSSGCRLSKSATRKVHRWGNPIDG